MIPYVYDTDFNRIGIIDDYVSFIWTERYYQPGDFEIVVPALGKFVDLLKPGRYLVREDRLEWGIIEKISIEQIERISDANSRMIVSGRFASSIVGRRVIPWLSYFNNLTPAQAITGLLNNHLIQPLNTERTIADFIYTDLSGVTTTFSQQFTGKNLLDAIEDITQSRGIGFRCDRDAGKWVFKTYKGTDRSTNQSEVPPVIFSVEYDNLDSLQYEADYQNIHTAVRIGGEGQGSSRKMYWYDTGATGLERYEYFKDARNSSTNNGEISDETYRQQLLAEAAEEITFIKEAVAGKVDFTNIVYREDVFLGDICTVRWEEWGIEMHPRLIEVIESTDEAGMHTFTPTFGE